MMYENDSYSQIMNKLRTRVSRRGPRLTPQEIYYLQIVLATQEKNEEKLLYLYHTQCDNITRYILHTKNTDRKYKMRYLSENRMKMAPFEYTVINSTI